VRELFLAVEENDTKALRPFLAQRNVNPDTLFETRIFEEKTFTWSALHAAAYYGSKDVVDLLMEFNANVELEDTWYRGRPLAWAAFGGIISVRIALSLVSALRHMRTSHRLANVKLY